MMKQRGVAFCPTLSATESTTRYRGRKKESTPAGITH
jgi:hypothetical protein